MRAWGKYRVRPVDYRYIHERILVTRYLNNMYIQCSAWHSEMFTQTFKHVHNTKSNDEKHKLLFC